MKADRFSWIWLALLCLFGFFHSAVYALSNPVFESPDEPGHLGYVNRFASGKGMPNQYDSKDNLPEGHQTPLYYFLGGNLFRVFGGPISVSLPLSNTPQPAPAFDHRPNPFRSSRDKFLFYGLRLIGSALVGFTVLQTGRAARKMMPIGHVWMVGPMVVATLPQFAYIGSSISNDVLVTFFGACVVYAAACCSGEPNIRRNWLLLGAYLGLVFLAKKSGIIFVPAIFVIVGALLFYKRDQVIKKKIAVNVFLTTIIALIIFSPFLIHNFQYYHEPLGNQMEIDTMPNLVYAQSLNSFHFRYIIPHVVPVSFVSQFGWMVVEVPSVYVWSMVWTIAAMSVTGLLAIFDRRLGAFALFCLAAFASNLFGLVYYNLLFPQAQGRLLFPSLSALALLCALGMYQISGKVRLPYKSFALAPIAVWLLWFDLLCYWANVNFYAWFGPRLGF